MVDLSWEDAEAITRRMPFERQRDADKTHIGMLADMFLNGEFAPGSQITFAIDEDGNPRLVDGQHRLRAAAQAKWDGIWERQGSVGSAAYGRSGLHDAGQLREKAPCRCHR